MSSAAIPAAPKPSVMNPKANSELSLPSSVKACIKKPSWWQALFNWLDSDYFPQGAAAARKQKPAITWDRFLPFLFIQLGCLGIIWVGWSPLAVGVAISLYWLRMFAITGFLHRYFSHRTFKTSRWFQFVMALWTSICVQRGALWWAANHRHHHRFSDMPNDLHSPKQTGFWYAHMGWMLSEHAMPTDYKEVKDLAKFPELVFLNRFDWLGSFILIAALAIAGSVLQQTNPELGTSGWQMVIWGFFVSTTLLFHGTQTINSLAHVWGSRRYETKDTSRNNFWLSIITMGEGWHNNHHHCPGTVRQGFYWWEIDMTYYLLKMLEAFGLIWDLRQPPRSVVEAGRRANARG